MYGLLSAASIGATPARDTNKATFHQPQTPSRHPPPPPASNSLTGGIINCRKAPVESPRPHTRVPMFFRARATVLTLTKGPGMELLKWAWAGSPPASWLVLLRYVDLPVAWWGWHAGAMSTSTRAERERLAGFLNDMLKALGRTERQRWGGVHVRLHLRTGQPPVLRPPVPRDLRNAAEEGQVDRRTPRATNGLCRSVAQTKHRGNSWHTG